VHRSLNTVLNRARSVELLSLASNHDTCLLNGFVDFSNGVDEASVSKRDVLAYSDIPVFFYSRGHDFLETRVNDINLVSTLELFL